MITTRALAFAGLGLLFACSSDSTADGPPGGADAPAATPDAPGSSKTFTVTLTKAGEPTQCANAGASATGSATVTINADNSIAVTNLTFSGLSGPAVAAHIHYGTATTASGPVVLPFAANPTSPVNKTFTAADYASPVPTGAPATYADFVTMARAGNNAYINVHTAMCQGGEIRGELQ